MDDTTVEEVLNAFRYGLLMPGGSSENAALLGPCTLGIEVTIPELAARCGLGNLDPQHTGGDVSRAAVEAALEAPLPETGSRLVTVRPDADAFAAMAVLAARRADRALGAAARTRIDLVARADRFDRGPWPGVRPLPTDVAALEKDGASEADLVAIRGACFDANLDVPEKVEIVLRWLLRGDEPPRYREAWRVRQRGLIDALRGGEVRLETRHADRIVVLEAARNDALNLAYYLAPVVVACNPAFRWRGTGEPHTRYAVAQWEPGWIDLAKVCDDLAALEPGWGGSPTIIGSPQGTGSDVSLDEVVAVAGRHVLDDPPDSRPSAHLL